MSEPAHPTASPVWRTHLPMALLGLLLALYAIFVATQADAHGRSWDEGAQDWYGEVVYQWYATRGADLTFMQADPAMQMPQHGPVVELVIAAAQHTFDGADHWHVRAVTGALIGALGVVGIALCGLELAGWWGAFLAAAGLALYPRYTGAIFNNSKDIPLAVAMIFLVWLTLRLARRWGAGQRYLFDSALLGAALGIAVSIRVNALLWTGVLGLLAVGWWWRRWRSRPAGEASAVATGTPEASAVATGTAEVGAGEGWPRALGRHLLAAALIVGCGYLAMLATWPYVALYPVDGLVDSIRSMSRYNWTGSIPFAGDLVPADRLPRTYAPLWLVVGSPLPTVVFGLAGAAFVVADLVRRRRLDERVLICAGLLVVPLAAIVVLRPTLYNGPRHFLFVVPGLILLGVHGMLRLWALLPRPAAGRVRAAAAGLVVVTVLAWAHVVFAAARLYPFEYMYFSPVVGGYLGARGDYETDYWAVCQNPALRWLVANHREYPTPSPPTLGGLFDEAVRMPPGFGSSPQPDFFISSPYYRTPDGYRPIHTVTLQGEPLCTVTINPAYAG